MYSYFAVIKTNFNATPMSLSFTAENPTEALKQMCKACNCTTTNELAEYDLLEVVGKDKYRPVAAKIGSDIHKPTATPTPAVITGEKEYIPYTLATHEDIV